MYVNATTPVTPAPITPTPAPMPILIDHDGDSFPSIPSRVTPKPPQCPPCLCDHDGVQFPPKPGGPGHGRA